MSLFDQTSLTVMLLKISEIVSKSVSLFPVVRKINKSKQIWQIANNKGCRWKASMEHYVRYGTLFLLFDLFEYASVAVVHLILLPYMDKIESNNSCMVWMIVFNPYVPIYITCAFAEC